MGFQPKGVPPGSWTKAGEAFSCHHKPYRYVVQWHLSQPKFEKKTKDICEIYANKSESNDLMLCPIRIEFNPTLAALAPSSSPVEQQHQR